MELSPEDKKRIYEEEKARIEAREKIEREKLTEAAGAGTSTGLSPNVAGLLCYVGIWISGIIFFVLEQKNRFVRFHAAQSIVAFGTITVAGIILGLIPVVGDVFISIIVIIGVIVWIIMIVKASSGEWYKLPGVGDVAEKMVASSGVTGEYSEPPPPEPAAEPEATTPPPAADSGKGIVDKIDAHFKGRSGRITASAFAIAWSIALLIFFNFFNQYVAYYHSETVGGVTTWIRYPFFTEDINLWLPVLTATLIITIVGHIILIILDRYILREMIHIIINAFSLWTILTLLTVFPFDFSVIPSTSAADATHTGVSIFLIFISVVVGIALLVRVIKLIVNVVRGTASYEESI
jgi:uncharacterized membrane protein